MNFMISLAKRYAGPLYRRRRMCAAPSLSRDSPQTVINDDDPQRVSSCLLYSWMRFDLASKIVLGPQSLPTLILNQLANCTLASRLA